MTRAERREALIRLGIAIGCMAWFLVVFVILKAVAG